MNLKAKPLTIYISAIISGFPMVGLASQNTDNVGAGETVFDVILDGGTQVVHGTVNNSIINAGRQDISASRDGNIGTANDTIINGGGQFVSGGITNGTVVNSGGIQTVTGVVYPGVGSYQGVANNTTVNDGGWQSVSTIANGTKVNTGGGMTIGLSSGTRGSSGVSIIQL